MRRPFDWIKRIVSGSKPGVLTLFTPPAAHDQNVLVRLALGGGALATLAVFGAIGAAAFITLMLAIGVMYFLATHVLGLKLQVDPRAFYEHVQRQAAATYGSN